MVDAVVIPCLKVTLLLGHSCQHVLFRHAEGICFGSCIVSQHVQLLIWLTGCYNEMWNCTKDVKVTCLLVDISFGSKWPAGVSATCHSGRTFCFLDGSNFLNYFLFPHWINGTCQNNKLEGCLSIRLRPPKCMQNDQRHQIREMLSAGFLEIVIFRDSGLQRFELIFQKLMWKNREGAQNE